MCTMHIPVPLIEIVGTVLIALSSTFCVQFTFLQQQLEVLPTVVENAPESAGL